MRFQDKNLCTKDLSMPVELRAVEGIQIPLGYA